MQELSAADLVRRSGTTAERLGHLIELGLVTPTAAGGYRGSDIQRIRVIDALADAGIAPEQLAGRLFDAWELPGPRPARPSGPTRTSCCAWPSRPWRASATTRRPCWARPGSSATACGAWPSRRCACSTTTSTTASAPRATRTSPGPTTSTRSPPR